MGNTSSVRFARSEKSSRTVPPLPPWCQTFRCRVIKPDTPRDLRQMIAGAEQARSSNVMHATLSSTLELLMMEIAEERKQGRSAEVSLSKCLDSVYTKTGRTPSRDGTQVCFSTGA